jgi:hypothetical protein
MPVTVTAREGLSFAEGLLPPAFAPALSLTPPTLCPHGSGDGVLDWALQGHGAVTRMSVRSRVQTLFLPAGTSAPGTDDPSTPTSSTDPTVDED